MISYSKIGKKYYCQFCSFVGSLSDFFSDYSLIETWVSVVRSLPVSWRGLVSSWTVIKYVHLSIYTPPLSVNSLKTSFNILFILQWLSFLVTHNRVWNWWLSWDMLRARASFHFQLMIACHGDVFFAKFSGHSESISNSFIPWCSKS